MDKGRTLNLLTYSASSHVSLAALYLSKNEAMPTYWDPLPGMSRAVRGGDDDDDDDLLPDEVDVDGHECDCESVVVAAPQAFSIALLASLAFKVLSDKSSSSFGSLLPIRSE